MDPCPFVRILVGNLAVKSPASSKPSSVSGKVHPSSSPFFCKILLQGLDSNSTSPRVSSVPLISDSDPHPHSFAASFDFSKAQILKASKKPLMKISVYKGPTTPPQISCKTDPNNGPFQPHRAVILAPNEGPPLHYCKTLFNNLRYLSTVKEVCNHLTF